MKRLKKFAIATLVASLVLLSSHTPANALYDSCKDIGIDFLGSAPPSTFETATLANFSFRIKGLASNGQYTLTVEGAPIQHITIKTETFASQPAQNGDFISPTITVNERDALNWIGSDVGVGNRTILLRGTGISGSGQAAGGLNDSCNLWNYTITPDTGNNNCTISLENEAGNTTRCFEFEEKIKINVDNITFDSQPYNQPVEIYVNGIKVGTPTPRNSSATLEIDGFANQRDFRVEVIKPHSYTMLCSRSGFKTDLSCTDDEIIDIPQDEDGPKSEGIFEICNTTTNPSDRAECIRCGDVGLWTALGCLKTDPNVFIPQLLTIAISIAGGIALLFMIFGAFRIAISAGDPKGVEEGRGMITNAVIGLVVIIFSVILLNLIGVSILKIPGL